MYVKKKAKKLYIQTYHPRIYIYIDIILFFHIDGCYPPFPPPFWIAFSFLHGIVFPPGFVVVVVIVVLTGTEKGETAWKKIPPPGVPELAGAEQNNSEHPPEKKNLGCL